VTRAEELAAIAAHPVMRLPTLTAVEALDRELALICRRNRAFVVDRAWRTQRAQTAAYQRRNRASLALASGEPARTSSLNLALGEGRGPSLGDP
jgi:hypothetical protein